MMMTQTALKLDNLCAGYGKNKVVDNASLEIQTGDIFGLVGLNGAGKTTLIKTVLGLRERMSGDISGFKKKDISYLPERFDPPWFLSGLEFIQFSLKFYNKKITKDQAIEEAKRVSLNPDFLTKRVHTYSKGMRQKLGLLATFLTGTPLLILDEPMSGLDPKARQEVKQIILDAKAQGRTVFMCSHILSDIEELCDQMAVFHNSTIIFKGTPKEMLAVNSNNNNSSNLETAFLSMIS